jgi:formylglycine-generating enzyme required for sulfatase activity
MREAPGLNRTQPFEVQFVLLGGSAKSRTKDDVMPWNAAAAQGDDVTHEYVGFRVMRPMPIEKF